MIFGYFGGPTAHFGGSGAHCEDFWDCYDFRSAPAAKTYSLLEAKMQPASTFWSVVFLMFFRVLIFSILFHDFKCPEVPFWLSFSFAFESPGPLKNNN